MERSSGASGFLRRRILLGGLGFGFCVGACGNNGQWFLVGLFRKGFLDGLLVGHLRVAIFGGLFGGLLGRFGSGVESSGSVIDSGDALRVVSSSLVTDDGPGICLVGFGGWIGGWLVYG